MIRSNVVQIPFYTGGHTLNTLEKDMYPADGWVLAFRDFGSPSAAPDVPFFALYNRYRGILRIMLYNSRELTYSRFNLDLSFKDPLATGAVLTYSDKTRAFRNDFDPAKVESFMVEANSIGGWIYGDFMLTGYDPTMNDATQLRLQLRGMDTSTLTLESTEFTLSEILSDANPGTSRSSGGDLVSAAKQGHKFYKSASDAAKSLRKVGADNSSKWWGGILKTVVGTPTQPSVLSTVAPIVGGLVGFISSFFGGEADPAPREPLNFEGSLKMSGTLTLSQPLYAMDLGLKYTVGGNPPDYYRALNNITWGVFNLNTRPTVYAAIKQECPTGNRPDCFRYAEAYLKDEPSYVFNPSAGLQLVSVNYAFTFLNRPPTGFSSSPDHYEVGGEMPNGLAVRVKMRTASPTLYFDDDLVFYKVYPFTKSLTP
ncbi:hypothetical protein POL68_38520 [Stigmatella sp. ncwal1]|uniref:Uncharacterized protein n=1 Tax=Stigmatella ashevillensis TaxID=2995309 RepID=A0ABT5DMZ8_9BACT|nr:hypothetical protein [Stigmatella ashevillena]MDC0714414.1 hypothetical protein [Stigmatella ashevillena]